MSHWEAVFKEPGSDETLIVLIQHEEEEYLEEYGITVTSEMKAKAVAKRENENAAKVYSREPYTLDSLRFVDG